MELKRILARDTRSANEKAMQLYGENVLVISTQRVGDQTELIVAIDAQEPGDVHNGQGFPPKVAQTSVEKDKEEVFAEIFGFVQRHERLSQDMQTGSVVPSAATDHSGTESPSENQKSDVISVPARTTSTRRSTGKSRGSSTSPSKKASSAKPVNRQSGAEKALAELLQQELARSREIVDLLRQEIGVLRREFTLSRQVEPWVSSLAMQPEVRALSDRMAQLGVPIGLRTLLNDIIAPCESLESAINSLQKILHGHLNDCVHQGLSRGAHVLIGPSGAGKTSMAVRLARMHASDHGMEQQAIISFSDKRPGAWSQLQTLAAAAGVDVYRANDADTLKVLLAELSNRSHIWIDTAAEAHFAISSELMDAHPSLYFHAVAPMDASAASMQRLQEGHFPCTSLMLTKADECDVAWHWMQALSAKPMAISWISNSEQTGIGAAPFDPDLWIQRALSCLMPSPVEVKSDLKQKTPPRKRRSTSEKVAHG